MIVSINGDMLDEESASISVLDRGFLFGDGVFETIAAAGGNVFWLDEHLERLLAGCSHLGIELLWTKAEIIENVEKTFRQSSFADARLRVTVTRGLQEQLSIHINESLKPNIIVYCQEITDWTAFQSPGLTVATSRQVRYWPEIKSLNFLASIMSSREARRLGADSALFIDDSLNVLEGSRWNVFCVQESKILTPAQGILPGITRTKVIELARELQHEVVEDTLPLETLLNSAEVFTTSTLSRVTPIVQVDDHLIVGGVVGKVTKNLQRLFSERYY